MTDHPATGTRQGPVQKLYCPDCGEWIKEPEFVAHREREHPPTPLELVASGIRTATRFGTDPTTEETD